MLVDPRGGSVTTEERFAEPALEALDTTHLKVGFFMNWFGNQLGEGLEYHPLALALALPLAVRGGGAFSLDRPLIEALELRRTLREPTTSAKSRRIPFKE